MSVAMKLGVADVDAPTMMEARLRWSAWTVTEPVLDVVEGLLDLTDWTRAAGPEASDPVLRSLAKLGSATGGDDPAAITALTWTLLPGATTVARDLSDLSNNIDELVASYLWTSARTFMWEVRRATASSILRDTRRAVLAELGKGEWARRIDRTWTTATCVDPGSVMWDRANVQIVSQDAAAELLQLFNAAADAGVVDHADRDLLLELSVAADAAAVPGRRGRGGLMVPDVSAEIADRLGLSTRTVRRRAARSIGRLSEFAANGYETPMSTPAQAMAMGA